MTFSEFSDLVTELKTARPIWFSLESDPPATEEELSTAEFQLGVKLPDAFRQFAKMFGGGFFAFGNVFSVRSDSEWSIVSRNQHSDLTQFLAVSDNGVGDEYGFRVENGKCRDEVVSYDHETNTISGLRFANLLEYLRETALTPY